MQAIIAPGLEALAFALRHGPDIAPGAPIVFSYVLPESLADLHPPASVTGVLRADSPDGTLALARRLQPDARDVVVITGASAPDRLLETLARRALAHYEPGLRFHYLTALPHQAEFSFGNITLQAKINGVFGPRNDVLGYIVNWEDVSQRQIVESEQARLASMLDNAPTNVLLADEINRATPKTK